MVTPLRASRRSQANTDLSSKIAGLPPAQTNTKSASRSVIGAAIGDDGDAVRGHHRLAAGRRVPPAIELPAREQVGGAERLDRRGIGHQREAGHEQEAHGLRRCGAGGGWRPDRESA